MGSQTDEQRKQNLPQFIHQSRSILLRRPLSSCISVRWEISIELIQSFIIKENENCWGTIVVGPDRVQARTALNSRSQRSILNKYTENLRWIETLDFCSEIYRVNAIFFVYASEDERIVFDILLNWAIYVGKVITILVILWKEFHNIVSFVITLLCFLLLWFKEQFSGGSIVSDRLTSCRSWFRTQGSILSLKTATENIVKEPNIWSHVTSTKKYTRSGPAWWILGPLSLTMRRPVFKNWKQHKPIVSD